MLGAYQHAPHALRAEAFEGMALPILRRRTGGASVWGGEGVVYVALGLLTASALMRCPDGRILNRHRKLIPTNPERMIWGRGDARGLNVVDTPAGRLGVLMCWENYMPLARYALYAQNLEVLVAPTWDCGDEWVASMRHIAREGGCYVIATGTAIQARDVPADFPERARVFPDADEWLDAATPRRSQGAPTSSGMRRVSSDQSSPIAAAASCVAPANASGGITCCQRRVMFSRSSSPMRGNIHPTNSGKRS